jgi:hypothetical protein
MARKTYSVLLLLLLILSLLAGGAWVHSYLDGREYAWADTETQQGGRVMSSQGQLIVQRCDLKPPAVAMEIPLLKKGTKAEMPKDFAVGSNVAGEQTVITISGFPVPFARPAPGVFIGRSSKSKFDVQSTIHSSGAEAGHWWYASWEEWVIAYWLLTLILIMLPLCEAGRRLSRRRKQEIEGSPAVAR